MQARNLSDSTDMMVQAMIEQLMQEWKVGDFAVAESIFKSRQRQLKQKGGAQMRQKMQVGKPGACDMPSATADLVSCIHCMSCCLPA